MDQLPTEFRLFARGVNASTKGEVLFDDAAAKSVMSAYNAHAVRLMIDLEHLSLEGPSDMDTDARGWFSLALRDGELWAVDVTWTDDGRRRLSGRTQVYTSPAFMTDDDLRVTKILNVALTSMPATHGATQLVAASVRTLTGDATMADESDSKKATLEMLAAIAVAMGLPADGPIEDVIAQLRGVLMALDGEPAAEPAAPVEEMSEDEEEPAALTEDEDDKEAEAAGARVLRMLTGRKTVSAALDEVNAWKASHLSLSQERERVKRDRVALERVERRSLVAQMVVIGSETPGTAWADADAQKPAEPWASMPLQKLRDRVKMLSTGRPVPTTPTAPTGGSTTEAGYTLSAREVAMCKAKKIDPEKYAATRAGIIARSTRKAG